MLISARSSMLAVVLVLAACSAAPASSNGGTAASSVAPDGGGGGGGSTSSGGSGGTGGGSSSGGSSGGSGAEAGIVADGATTPLVIVATFETEDTSQYLTDSAGTLTADGASAGANQTFTLTDLTSGALTSGDAVQLSANGAYLSAANGGGGALTFVTSAPGDDETFLLVRIADAGGAISAGDQVALQTKVTGNYVSAINGGGGQVLANAPWDRAWETYTLGVAGTTGADAGTGASQEDGGSSAALTARQKVLAFLNGISGTKTAIGVEDKSGGEADSDQMSTMAGNGQYPSFWSADWGFGSAAAPSSREAIVQEGEKQWGQGAIVQYIYHVCPLSWGSNEEGCEYSGGTDPIDGSCGDLSDAQWTDLTTAGGTLNGVWLARLDTIATYFQELKAAGIAPLFRPLHEINGSSANNGCWAWWQGRPGPTGSALLYRITHDYLVTTKGLDNIIWVYNLQDYSTLATDVNDYSPGESYFDIAALDIYDSGYTSDNYNAMVGVGAGKPIGVAECAYLPYPDTLTSQPLWTYVVVWPDFLYSPDQSYNSAQIPQLFADPQVITLAGMPGWQ